MASVHGFTEECVVVLDERSAGFFALGAAQATGLPVVLVCTSGSAAANYHPAVVEADLSAIPLVVLTSDRPPELRGIGSGQAIDQVKLYGDAVRWFADLGTPRGDDDGLLYVRQLACRACAAAAGDPRPGPVQVNFPFREPLAPRPGGEPVTATSPLALSGRVDRPQDWIYARLRRMVTPTAVLASSWLILIVGGFLTGAGAIVAAGATAAAIPLWFLSNYTIDTALAPYVLPRFRANPARFALLGLGAFVAIEVLRLAGVPWIPWINWVLGWLLFQVAGFAWRDGLLPTGRRLAAYAGLFWVGALSVVAFGPYPTSMVNVPGLEHSPTQPPTIALLLFGAAYSATALVFAPAITRYLARSRRAWALVVAANSFALSVYLWHMTAAVAASAVFYGLGALPTAPVGTSSWWFQKVPLLALSLVFLVGIVAVVSRVERKALFAPRSPWRGGQLSMLMVAAVLSVGVKLWAGGEVESVALGCAILLVVWHGKLSATERSRRTPSVLTGSYRG